MSSDSPVRRARAATAGPADTAPIPLTQVWFTTAEAADYTRKGRRTLMRAVYDGALLSDQCATPGAHHRFHRDELDRWLREGRAPARAARLAG